MSMQPVLKPNSTSFILNAFFSSMNIKEVTHQGGQREWVNLPHFLLEVETAVFTNIQAISTLLAFNLVFQMIMGLICVIIQILICNTCLIFINQMLCFPNLK